MPYLIGSDEAGYGPNLGPLLVAATAWEVPQGVQFDDLSRLLADAIADRPRRGGPPRVVIGDSKRLYQSGQGWQHLEAGLWPALACLGHAPRTWREVWQALAPDTLAEQTDNFWFHGFDAPAPRDAVPEQVAVATCLLQEALSAAGVRLAGIGCQAVFPEQFNRRLREVDSKGTLLSQVTLQLVGRLLAPLTSGPIHVLCDKHGGRSHYQALLEELFPERFIEICGESAARSVYRLGPAERRVEFRFQAKGEAYLPTALASMAAKYLRELAMQAWNAFWIARIPGLAPTAGYPQDARRFKQAIAPLQAALGIADDLIWRVK